MTADIAAEVTAILAREALLDPRELRADLPAADLGLDSLGLVEAIFAIEERFGITVPFNANTPEASAFGTATVGEIIAEVEALVRARG
ncbi:acyl carrier protein [Frigidibacter sp. RF13]|uniref:acyl carrier protein n=1 Tax=Frigidibacter sp. RF13 TaxID=2997340 RepID=UPI003B639883